MNLADVFTFLLVILGFVIVFVSYWLMAAGLFPDFVQRSAANFGKAPVRLPLLGLVTLVPLSVAALALSKAAPSAPVKAGALGILLVGLLAGLFGAAGLALRIGEGLKSARDESDPWRRVFRGSIVLGLSFVLPFIGTFLLLPYALLGGFGAFLAGVWRRQPAVAPAVPPLPVVTVSPETATASAQ